MGKATNRTEAAQLKALAKHTVRGYITRTELARFRANATNKTGWPATRLDAWLGRLVSQGKLRMGKTGRVGTAKAREMESAETPGAREEVRHLQKTRRWVESRAEKGVVTAAMFTQMKENLKEKRVGTLGVEAAVAYLEATGEVSLEDRVRGAGGKERREWRKEAKEWATKRGWVQIATSTLHSPPPLPKKEAVALELGSGWEGATEGLRRVWDRVITVDLSRHTMKAGAQSSAPDLLWSFEDLAALPTRWLQDKGRVKKGELAAIWASPSCKEFSTLQGLNPAPTPSLTKQNPGVAGVLAVIKIIKNMREQDRSIQFAIENSAWGSARNLTEVQKELGKGVVVAACAYGERQSGKKHRLWLSQETEREFRPRDPKGPKSQCQFCKQNKPHPQGYAPPPGSKQGRIRLEGYTSDAAKNRIPPALAEEVSQAMKRAREKTIGSGASG